MWLRVHLNLANGLEHTVVADANQPFEIEKHIPLDLDVESWYVERV